MRISIVTPSFNQGRYLAATIESVIAQQGDFALDYLIVDGGSQDDSVAIIQHYEQLLAEKRWEIRCREIIYRWHSEADRGQADAIIKGFRLADGEILAWLNSDDTYVEGALRTIARYFAANPEVAVVYGDAHYVNEAGAVVGSYPTGPFDAQLLPVFNFICQPAVFFRSSALLTVGGLDPSLQFVMDYDLWIRLSQKFVFHYLCQPLATYRLHRESKTVSSRTALANATEALNAVVRHYNWAPVNRVYVCCLQMLQQKYPVADRRLLVAAAFVSALAKYLALNRSIRLNDLKMINNSSLRKLRRNVENAPGAN